MSKLDEFRRKFKFDRFTGFGNVASNQADRLLNRDGQFNVRRSGIGIFARINAYHRLIQMSWFKFFLVIIGGFAVVNILFSAAYYAIGLHELTGIIHSDETSRFIEVFTFSAQTLTTVGYGRINPIGDLASLVSSIEALMGLLNFALITGLLYGRFSRPYAKLLFSHNALIAPYQNRTALMFRIANARQNQLLGCEGTVLFNYFDKETNSRRFINLNLEITKITALSLSWTLVHPIDENSPVWGLTKTDLQELKAELIFLFKGFDDTYSQVVHSRYSYLADEIEYGGKFVPMYKRSVSGNETVLELDKISSFEYVSLPVPANELISSEISS